MKVEILKKRQRIYQNIKQRALSLESRTPELNKYLEDQSKFASSNFTTSTPEELKESILASDFIFIGDFHTFEQNVRNLLRTIKVLQENNRSFFVALEMVQAEKQICIEAFLEKHVTEFEFLEAIDYGKTWRFPWTHYKEIFQLAKKDQFPLIGLNTEGSLKERDHFAAKLLQEKSELYEGMTCVTLYGELHIVADKLPKAVKFFFPDKKQLLIHQNLDEVYWKSVQANNETQILRANNEEFCILASPPWIKYESMIYWYENLYNDPDFDLNEYIIETGRKFFSEDTQEMFNTLCEEMKTVIGLSIKPELVSDFNLYDHTNIDFIEDKLEEYSSEIQELLWQQLELGISFRLPDTPSYYCSNYSLNRLSYLVGTHFFYCYQDHISLASFEKDNESRFVTYCFEACFSYFFSKLINPHRKCNLYQDYLKDGVTLQENILIKSLEQSLSLTQLNNTAPKELKTVAMNTGHIIGEYLYLKAYKEMISKKEIERLMNLSIDLKSLFELINSALDGQDFKNDKKRFI